MNDNILVMSLVILHCAIRPHGTFKDRILHRNEAGYGVVILVREIRTVFELALLVAPLLSSVKHV